MPYRCIPVECKIGFLITFFAKVAETSVVSNTFTTWGNIALKRPNCSMLKSVFEIYCYVEISTLVNFILIADFHSICNIGKGDIMKLDLN